MTILLISDDDRSALACELLALQLRKLGKSCLTLGTSAQASSLKALSSPLPTCEPQITMALDALVGSSLLEQTSAVGLFLRDPEQLKRFATSHRNLAHHQGRQAAPIFSGPLQASLGDRLIKELHDRLCCDLLILPGKSQERALRSVTQYWPADVPLPQLLSMGFWYSPERPPQGSLNGGIARPPHHLLVLAQDLAPTTIGGKSQLLRQLIQWAKTAPEWTFTVQRDQAWSDKSTWIPRYDPKKWELPPNLVFAASGQMLTHLASCSVCLSISSPWSMTAMTWGRKTILMGDYGIHTNVGTTSWFGCGCLHHLRGVQSPEQLLELPKANQTWLESMGWGIHDGALRLINRLEALVA